MRRVRRYETGGETVESLRLGCPHGGGRVFISCWHHQFSGSLLGVCHNEKTRSDAGPAQLEINVKKEEEKP